MVPADTTLKTTYFIYASSIIIANIFVLLADGIITTIPNDREALVGQSTYFNCSSSVHDKNVDWYFYPVGVPSHDRKYVYAFGELSNPDANKFQIQDTPSGVCNLVIRNVTLKDAGRYECQDDEGIGEKKSAELVVLGANPICSSSLSTNELIGPNSCDIEPDELRLSCGVTYRGNIHPILEWKSSKENQSVVGSVTSENKSNIVTYHLTMKADLLVTGASYFCQVTKSATDQHSKPNCSSETIHLHYVFNNSLRLNASVGAKIVCVANTSQLCDYKWKWFENDGFTTESYNATLIPKKTGWHRCEATCVIRTHSCTITVMTANVSVPKPSAFVKLSSFIDKTLEIVIPVVVVVLVATVIVLCVYIRKLQGKTVPKFCVCLPKDPGNSRQGNTPKGTPPEENPLNVDCKTAENDTSGGPIQDNVQDIAMVKHQKKLDDMNANVAESTESI